MAVLPLNLQNLEGEICQAKDEQQHVHKQTAAQKEEILQKYQQCRKEVQALARKLNRTGNQARQEKVFSQSHNEKFKELATRILDSVCQIEEAVEENFFDPDESGEKHLVKTLRKKLLGFQASDEKLQTKPASVLQSLEGEVARARKEQQERKQTTAKKKNPYGKLFGQ